MQIRIIGADDTQWLSATTTAEGGDTIAMAMGLMSGFVSCSSRRHKAKTFTEASCSTDDIDFDALNDAGELEVDIEETQAILGAGGADGGENYGGDDDDDDTL